MLIFNNLLFWLNNLFINGTSRWWGMTPNHSRGLDTNIIRTKYINMYGNGI